MHLFAERGFDAVTVADANGISRRASAGSFAGGIRAWALLHAWRDLARLRSSQRWEERHEGSEIDLRFDRRRERCGARDDAVQFRTEER